MGAAHERRVFLGGLIRYRLSPAQFLPSRRLLVPDLGELAGWLLWDQPDSALALRTGSLCRISISWQGSGSKYSTRRGAE